MAAAAAAAAWLALSATVQANPARRTRQTNTTNTSRAKPSAVDTHTTQATAPQTYQEPTMAGGNELPPGQRTLNSFFTGSKKPKPTTDSAAAEPAAQSGPTSDVTDPTADDTLPSLASASASAECFYNDDDHFQSVDNEDSDDESVHVDRDDRDAGGGTELAAPRGRSPDTDTSDTVSPFIYINCLHIPVHVLHMYSFCTIFCNCST